VDETNKMVKDKNLYAGGDVINLGLATDAVGHGRCAAQAIDFTLRGLEMPAPLPKSEIKAKKMKTDYYEKADRLEQEQLAIEDRLSDMIAEVNKGLTPDQTIQEAKRCLSCGYCFGCEQCWIMCQEQAVIKPPEKGQAFMFDLNKCNGCDKCAEVCPCGYIEMQ
jgi:Pyruvate/2-oxoacid:ferredoxin oxidoreductase delta subunit